MRCHAHCYFLVMFDAMLLVVFFLHLLLFIMIIVLFLFVCCHVKYRTYCYAVCFDCCYALVCSVLSCSVMLCSVKIYCNLL